MRLFVKQSNNDETSIIFHHKDYNKNSSRMHQTSDLGSILISIFGPDNNAETQRSYSKDKLAPGKQSKTEHLEKANS